MTLLNATKYINTLSGFLLVLVSRSEHKTAIWFKVPKDNWTAEKETC